MTTEPPDDAWLGPKSHRRPGPTVWVTTARHAKPGKRRKPLPGRRHEKPGPDGILPCCGRRRIPGTEPAVTPYLMCGGPNA